MDLLAHLHLKFTRPVNKTAHRFSRHNRGSLSTNKGKNHGGYEIITDAKKDEQIDPTPHRHQ